MEVNNQDITDIKATLADIQNKVTEDTPNRFQRLMAKWQYRILIGAWLIGAATHKFGAFEVLSKIL